MDEKERIQEWVESNLKFPLDRLIEMTGGLSKSHNRDCLRDGTYIFYLRLVEIEQALVRFMAAP